LSLFDPASGSLYYYTKGWNLKALACWISAASFGIPGLVGAYHPTWVSAAAIHMYQTGWVLCFATAAVFYLVTNRLLPARVLPEGHTGEERSFEKLAVNEGYFDDEKVIEWNVVNGREVDAHKFGETTVFAKSNDTAPEEKV
jgi:NCS1 family nucleobase:cation symporter-1